MKGGWAWDERGNGRGTSCEMMEWRAKSEKDEQHIANPVDLRLGEQMTDGQLGVNVTNSRSVCMRMQIL